MSHSLTERPSIEYLRKEAKDLLKSQKAGSPHTNDVFRLLRRFSHASDEEIPSAEVSLHEAQFALAMDYGFASWDQLVSNVSTLSAQTSEERDSQRVTIQGVPHGRFDIHWDMPVRAMETLLSFRGIRAERDELLTVSGDALGICHASHWQGTAYLCTPTNPVRNMAEGYGFHYSSTHMGPTGALLSGKTRDERMALTREVLDHIHTEIDAGRPVLVSGAEAHCGSSSLVVGYQKDRDWLCHVGDGRAYRWTPLRGVADEAVDSDFGLMDGRCRGTVTQGFVGGWQASPAYLIGEQLSAPTERDRLLGAMKLAVELHRAPTADIWNWGGVTYYFGADAFEKWSHEMAQLDYPNDLDGPYETNGVENAYDWYEMGNMDIQVDQIVTGRSAAASYFRRSASLLKAPARKSIVNAAEFYEAEVDLARQAFSPFIPRFNGDDGPREAWLSDASKRKSGSEAAMQILEKEKAAIAAMEMALASAQ